MIRDLKGKTMLTTLQAKWDTFKADDEGISAIEFALIAPIMATIYFGCIELSMMMTLDRKVTSATATLGDLTARATNITNDNLSDIFEATRMLMQPNDMAKANMRITSIINDPNDSDGDDTNGIEMRVLWSDSCGTTLSEYATDDILNDVPPDLVPVGETLILAEIEYPYKSPIEFFFAGEKQLTDKFYLRPRRVSSITRDDSSPTNHSCGYTAP